MSGLTEQDRIDQLERELREYIHDIELQNQEIHEYWERIGELCKP